MDDDALTHLLAGPPERGLLEVKGFSDDVVTIAGTKQVGRYLAQSGLVLVTNYWNFLVVTRGQDGALILGDRFRLTPSARVFQGGLADPTSLAQDQGDGVVDFLRRTMLRRATLADPADVADLLAHYARDARRRIERTGSTKGLSALRRSLGEALGISFEGERGDAFFRSTLVQTLFYGLFSAWVLWSNRHQPDDRFHWREAVDELRVPVIQSLFYQITQPQRLRNLKLGELLDWTSDTLNRVHHETFFARFEREHAVRYFYEPLLSWTAAEGERLARWGDPLGTGITGRLRAPRSGDPGHLPQRKCPLGQRPRARLGLHHRQLPGDQEVAQLPGAARPWPQPDGGRGPGRRRAGPPDRHHPPARAAPGRQLPRGRHRPVPVATPAVRRRPAAVDVVAVETEPALTGPAERHQRWGWRAPRNLAFS